MVLILLIIEFLSIVNSSDMDCADEYILMLATSTSGT